LDEGPTVSVKVRRSPVLADDAARRDLVLATPRTSRSSRASQVVAGFLLKSCTEPPSTADGHP
jgi:hypothetical protein